jgi:hypothetical protein
VVNPRLEGSIETLLHPFPHPHPPLYPHQKRTLNLGKIFFLKKVRDKEQAKIGEEKVMEKEKLLLAEAWLKLQEEQKVLEEKIRPWNYLHLIHFETKPTMCIANGRGIYWLIAKTSSGSSATYARRLIIIQMYVSTTLDYCSPKKHSLLGQIRYNHKGVNLHLHPPSQCMFNHNLLYHFPLFMPNNLFLTTLFLTPTKPHPIMSSQQSTLHHPI